MTKEIFTLDKIEKPTMLLDMSKAIRNIEKMVTKANLSGVKFRPHFKTHQSIEIGDWFRNYGVDSITASSVDMAISFANAGWRDITIAFPVNLRQIEKINWLAERISLNLLVETADSAYQLSQLLRSQVKVWIKIDAGYHRTGVPTNNLDGILQIAQTIDALPRLAFIGILTHAGHTYHARSKSEIVAMYEEVLGKMKLIQTNLEAHGLVTAISIGDTPSCSVVDKFNGLDEIRPGNFVFNDLMQLQIGSCTEEDIAVSVACPVVAKHESRLQIVLCGGAIHFSKEYLTLEDGRLIYGTVANMTKSGWGPMVTEAHLIALSQEHGVVQATKELFNQTKVGDLLLLIPVHSCLTANLLKKYLLLDGTIINTI